MRRCETSLSSPLTIPQQLPMSFSTASRGLARALLGAGRVSTPVRAIPFFLPSSSSIGHPPPFFHPSPLHSPFVIPHSAFFSRHTPSSTFAGLRTAFHTSSRPSPSPFPQLQRGFSSTAKSNGIRPYYGNTNRGRRPSNWKDRINSIESVWVLGGLIGSSSSSCFFSQASGTDRKFSVQSSTSRSIVLGRTVRNSRLDSEMRAGSSSFNGTLPFHGRTSPKVECESSLLYCE